MLAFYWLFPIVFFVVVVVVVVTVMKAEVQTHTNVHLFSHELKLYTTLLDSKADSDFITTPISFKVA